MKAVIQLQELENEQKKPEPSGQISLWPTWLT